MKNKSKKEVNGELFRRYDSTESSEYEKPAEHAVKNKKASSVNAVDSVEWWFTGAIKVSWGF